MIGLPESIETNGNEILHVDEETFVLLYAKFWKKLYYLCYQKLNDNDLALDMVHDLFESIWERRNALVISDSMEKYLVTFVKRFSKRLGFHQ